MRTLPVAAFCQARLGGDPGGYPRKTAKAERPHRHGIAWLATRDGQVALVRRPARGLLGGMLALPSSDWRSAPFTPAEVRSGAPAAGDWRSMGEIDHIFTHFSLTLQVWRAEVAGEVEGAVWTPLADADEGLPSVFLKSAEARRRAVVTWSSLPPLMGEVPREAKE